MRKQAATHAPTHAKRALLSPYAVNEKDSQTKRFYTRIITLVILHTVLRGMQRS